MKNEKSLPEKDAVEIEITENQPAELIDQVEREMDENKLSLPDENQVDTDVPSVNSTAHDLDNEVIPSPEIASVEETLNDKNIDDPASDLDQMGVEGSVTSLNSGESQKNKKKSVEKIKTEKSVPVEDEDNHTEISYDDVDIDSYSREQIVEALAEIVNETNISLIKKKITSLKVAFLRENKIEREKKREEFVAAGGNIEEYVTDLDVVEEKFKALFDIYKQNKAKFNKSQEELKLQNLELKKQILEELKVLNNSEETLKKTYDEFKILQERWKEIGIVPQAEINNLWQSYHFLVEMFFDKVKINKELRDLDLRKNLELKVEICEKTEELLIDPSITKSFKELQNFHEQWKKIGPVPMDVKDDIWERFKQASDKINERRREFYGDLHEEQTKNLEAKLVLCEQAEELLETESNTLKEWQDQTDKVNKLLEEWKSIGPAPKKVNDEVWKRFKSLLNGFFEIKKDFYSKLKEQQLNNYNKKLDLCLQAESLRDSEDWKKTTDDLINLQKEWKTLGPVPKKYSDKVWKRFRAACDDFFTKKANYYSNIHVHEEANLNQKIELIQKIKNYSFGADKKQNLVVFKDFQREWMQIGHVPIKEKEKLQAEFRKAINAHLEHLKINQTEINTINYKSKIENLSDSPATRNMIYKERSFLSNKISKMKEDINLWENNVGFLANSKNANILKAEFEKKIECAKNDLALMESKLKVLNSTDIG
ncbi:MAG: DUF349 domain-containing protein [Bacteroidetes bacterium]|nr:DUF349 domain-containing protein [Bacteroidota bacterium]